MQRIRIIHLIHQLGFGGAENGIINLLNRVNRDEFEISLCAFVKNGSQTYRLNRDRTALFEFDKSSGNDVTLPFKLAKLFRQYKPHIVHTHAWGTLLEGVIGAKLAQVPVLVHGEHGTIQVKSVNIMIQRLLWNNVDQVLSVSHEHAKRLSYKIGIPVKKVKVIANGVDFDRFGKKLLKHEYRAKLGIQRNDIAIGTVGRLVAVKNQILLIKAFSKLVRKNKHLKLFIVGDGPLSNHLKNQANELGCLDHTFFLGKRSDIPEIMVALDVFALTSLSEGMSNTILESMCSGLPVVATNVGGNIELVINGVTGRLIPSDDVDALVNALNWLVENHRRREEMGQAGRERIEMQFSMQKMVNSYEKLYKQLCKSKAKYESGLSC